MLSRFEWMFFEKSRHAPAIADRLGCAGMMSSVLLLTLAIIYVAGGRRVRCWVPWLRISWEFPWILIDSNGFLMDLNGFDTCFNIGKKLRKS